MAPASSECQARRRRTARARSCLTGEPRARKHTGWRASGDLEREDRGVVASVLPLLSPPFTRTRSYRHPAAATWFLPALLARYSSSSAFSTSCSRLDTPSVRAATPTETVTALPKGVPFP